MIRSPTLTGNRRQYRKYERLTTRAPQQDRQRSVHAELGPARHEVVRDPLTERALRTVERRGEVEPDVGGGQEQAVLAAEIPGVQVGRDLGRARDRVDGRGASSRP